MIVSVDVPDPIARQLHLDGEQDKRRTLEMVALQGYGTGEITRGKVGKLLGMAFIEAVVKSSKANARWTKLAV